MCIFELEYILFVILTSSINAGVNQTFSVTLLVTMIHLVVNEALLFNIFTRALYKIMPRDILYFLIFINPTRVIDDLQKSRGLYSVSAYRHGLYIYSIQVHACGCSAE